MQFVRWSRNRRFDIKRLAHECRNDNDWELKASSNKIHKCQRSDERRLKHAHRVEDVRMLVLTG
jgi:hypothetical protein